MTIQAKRYPDFGLFEVHESTFEPSTGGAVPMQFTNAAPGGRFCAFCLSPMSEKVARQVDQAEEAMREAMTADPDLLIKAAEIIRKQRAAKD